MLCLLKQTKKLMANFHYWQECHLDFTLFLKMLFLLFAGAVGMIVMTVCICYLPHNMLILLTTLIGTVTCFASGIIAGLIPYLLIIKLPERIARKVAGANLVKST